MGLFQWLGKLLDDLIDWIGEKAKVFLERLMRALQEVWETVVAAALLAAFGYVPVLHVIFYAAAVAGVTMMEVWDPKYYKEKPSEVFKLKQAKQNSPLPKKRSEAKVLTLEQ